MDAEYETGDYENLETAALRSSAERGFMHGHTPEQRHAYAETLYRLIREWVEQGDARFEIDLKRGAEWCTDVRTGDPTPRPNATLTLVLRINGGAEDSQGPAILPRTRLFEDPGVRDANGPED